MPGRPLQNLLSLSILCLSLFSPCSPTPELRYEDNIGCSTNCEYCDTESDICGRCAPGFYFDYKIRQCASTADTIPNCEYYSSSQVCSKCKERYTLYQGKCQECVKSCRNCDQNVFECEKCAVGFTKPNAASKVCTQVCSVPNCDTCQVGNAIICNKCMDGFRKVATGTCQKCVAKNCKSCQTNTNQCDFVENENTCEDGYFPLNGGCDPCDGGCRKCDFSGLCLACNTSGGQHMWMDMKCHSANMLKTHLWLAIFFIALYFS